jgi:hypothetical protein
MLALRLFAAPNGQTLCPFIGKFVQAYLELVLGLRLVLELLDKHTSCTLSSVNASLVSP